MITVKQAAHSGSSLGEEIPGASGAHAATAVLQVAERLHAMEPEWVVYFREVLGVDRDRKSVV